ncbi:hypothetical protein ATJ93_3763 [Halopiger aswanensis]|uniref:Uncharacterized protein n=1 Tax=Halopiger aswanensis TaxID=148449 RepID=A0A3R7DWZ5_9EURY|nr:hypothetical protein ATJ93_3763 [Halopiger aswanensis]
MTNSLEFLLLTETMQLYLNAVATNLQTHRSDLRRSQMVYTAE